MGTKRSGFAAWALLTGLGLVACGGDAGQLGPTADAGGSRLPPGSTPIDPGPAVTSSAQQLRFEALREQAEAAEALDADAALEAHPARFLSALDYDPAQSQGLDTIQGSALALSEAELAKLGEQGFVISTRREFPTFLRGLAEIYSEHLPLYLSVDTILESIHSSYDALLLAIEQAVLVPELTLLLQAMRERLEGADGDAALRAELDLYLSVAQGLLTGEVPEPVAGADAARVAELLSSAGRASGVQVVTLFGVEREEDFSQFAPRGHYEGDPVLERYFRAMIWLGRIDLRLIETLRDGSQVFRPLSYQATLLLHSLVAPDAERWQRIDDAIRTFVGESDSMTVPEVQALADDLGGFEAARSASDTQVVEAIVAGGYGEQQIASHLMRNDGTVKTLPLNRSFLLFGQRYVPDAHVLSAVVYDRIEERLMPNPLDAAFAALGNNQALALSEAELRVVPELPGALARMRLLVDAHDRGFWQANFYNLWLDSLRALSPAPDLAGAAPEGLPQVARTEAWGRRVLSAQLGSWAELRHDTLLYAKQSYSGIPLCDFPDVYVDPYPEAFDAMLRYAEQGARIVGLAALAESTDLAARVSAYFAALRDVTSRLADMARAQRAGEPFTEAQRAFIDNAVRVVQQDVVCTVVDAPDGWYAELFFDREKTLEFDPTIADVHTQPADEVGNLVGKVLHAGTGYPRYFVTTIDTCDGPRAYAGVVFAYHERITEDFVRLTDSQWARSFESDRLRPVDVPWLEPVLAR